MNLDAAIRTVRSGLELYGFGETAALELVKYRENYVFRLTAGTGEGYAVRLHRAGYRQDAEIRTEMAYLHALAGRGLSVPEPVPALDGGLMSTVTAEDGTVFQLDVLRWIEGAHPLGDITEALAGESSLGPEVFRKLGVLAAEL
ncbi:phosphotransferase, partial [Arthrobacter deserti]|nr:phosphotransferase [Arthrobacter deserti]